MNRFVTKDTRTMAFVEGKIKAFEKGEMTLLADKIQLFQDILDLGMDENLSTPAKTYMNLLLNHQLISPVKAVELN